MKVSAEVSLLPLGTPSLTPSIVRFLEILQEEGLEIQVGPMGTVLTGDWDTISKALEKGVKTLMEEGLGRVYLVLKLDISEKGGPPEEKVRKVLDLLSKRR